MESHSKPLCFLLFFTVLSLSSLADDASDKKALSSFVKKCAAGKRTELSDLDRMNAMIFLRRNPHDMTPTQKKWVYEQYVDLLKRVRTGTEADTVVVRSHEEFDSRKHDFSIDDLKYVIKVFQANGDIVMPQRNAYNWLMMQLKPIPEQSVEAIKNASTPEELQDLLESLRFKPEVSTSGRTVVYSHPQYFHQIRLANFTGTEAILPLNKETALEIAEAIRKGKDYTSPEAIAPEVFRRESLYDFKPYVKEELGWGETYDPRSNTLTYSHPNGKTKITIPEHVPGNDFRNFTVGERKGFREAVEKGIHYTSPIAQEAILKGQIVSPEELKLVESIGAEKDLLNFFKKKLYWEGEPNNKKRIITFTDPTFKNTITFDMNSKENLAPTENEKLRDALVTHKNYISPSAQAKK